MPVIVEWVFLSAERSRNSFSHSMSSCSSFCIACSFSSKLARSIVLRRAILLLSSCLLGRQLAGLASPPTATCALEVLSGVTGQLISRLHERTKSALLGFEVANQ